MAEGLQRRPPGTAMRSHDAKCRLSSWARASEDWSCRRRGLERLRVDDVCEGAAHRGERVRLERH